MLLDSLSAVKYLTEMLNKYKIPEDVNINFTGELTKDNIKRCVMLFKQDEPITPIIQYNSNILPTENYTYFKGVENMLIDFFTKYYTSIFDIHKIKYESEIMYAICNKHNFESDLELLIGMCVRNEQGYTKFRLHTFNVLELIFKYNKWNGDVYRDAILKFIKMYNRISFKVEFANDSFLNNTLNKKELIAYQQFAKVKQEIRLLTTTGYVAVASINDHKDINVKKYNLINTLGTGCSSIGISRLAKILLEYYTISEIQAILKSNMVDI